MNRYLTATIIFLFSIIPGSLQAQELSAILENHFKVIGQEKLLQVETITTEGTLLQAGITFQVKSFMKRPNKIRIQGSYQNTAFIQAYNGSVAWGVNPFAGITKAQKLSDEETVKLSEQANFDGLLFTYQEQGYKAELLDPQNIGDILVDVIKLSKPDGTEITYYLDSETSVILRSHTKMVIGGIEREYDTTFRDYKFVDGILFPFTVDVSVKGQEVMNYRFTKIELNKSIPDFIFNMPKEIE